MINKKRNVTETPNSGFTWLFSIKHVCILVTPTDRPKSVRNRCVIEVFGGVCVCCPLVFEFSVGIGGFVIGLGQISFFFSSNQS